ncbi:hypothetical protein GUITHDRAFT_101885 [Guillardia theta CCMP2712]|uniref:SET domain-containing protein n=1 Tax=Guillardia theta (strain CCMP2712) TaxID=905079 RepID=L1JWM6_GUITC|nr:hypothetical protein GUITHDRAFT_101885 [Guillardia theta CCMP2712]EKX52734.1 hypothetical protein GUITHDRAFT_101885 [Guillardia theta CCMP2712]|eukprot:XP_005839714.1 hypothetical protein GUITHDRAFT_101885 [Guillardia theta CCMP2712]
MHIRRKFTSLPHREENVCGLRSVGMKVKGEGEVKRRGMEQMDQVELWMIEKKVRAADLEHAFIPRKHGDVRGIVAKKEMQLDETMVRLPRDAVLCVKGNEPCPDDKLLEFWNRYDKWYVRLGLKLLMEQRKGSKSAIWGYIRLLPEVDQVQNFPCEWDEELLDELKCESIIASVKKQKKVWAEMVQEFPKLCPGSDFSAQELRWSWHMCLSRAFAGQFGGGMLSMIPVVGLVIELLASLNPSKDDFALLPIIDSCNHDGRINKTDLVFNPLSNELILRNGQGTLKAGEEVRITYGTLDNDELLQRFGFVEDNCLHDKVKIGINDIAEAMQASHAERDILWRERLLEAGLGSACLDELVIGRRGAVDRPAEVQLALGILFGEAGKGVSSFERVSSEVLGRVCQHVLLGKYAVGDLQVGAGGDGASEVQVNLVKEYREARASVLREAILVHNK